MVVSMKETTTDYNKQMTMPNRLLTYRYNSDYQ